MNGIGRERMGLSDYYYYYYYYYYYHHKIKTQSRSSYFRGISRVCVSDGTKIKIYGYDGTKVLSNFEKSPKEERILTCLGKKKDFIDFV